MKPDKKYMSQSSSGTMNIRFIPPSFSNEVRNSIPLDQNADEYLNLYPSETQNEFLYCYYSSFGDCDANNSILAKKNDNRIPTPSEVLMNLDLELDEDTDLDRTCSTNDIDKIYSLIMENHPGILVTLTSYRIPKPISKILIRRLIKLTLSYCEKEGDD